MTFMTFMPLFIPMLGFMFVAVMTPGPNNIMVAASGANFGFIRTLPHMCGISIGFFILLLLLGFGLEQLFQHSPLIRQAFRITALAFIFYLAWGIAKSGRTQKAEVKGRPQFLWEAALFQLINPKALVMSITVLSTFISPDHDYISQYTILVISFVGLTFFSNIVWAGFGIFISRFLSTPKRQRIFNWTMACLLVASIMPVAFDMLA